MAAMSEKNSQHGVIPGGNGRLIDWGVAAFNSTDAISTFKTHLRVVEAVIITLAGAPNTDETPYWADTLNAQGTLLVPNTGVVQIGRTGTKTDSLKCSLLLIGF